jgi:hypothetical protein
MTFINTDGMALIGPGSEWFWTALTGIVLAITFIAISRQLRIQAHLSAVEQVESFSRESTSDSMARHLLDILVAVRDGKDPADLPDTAAIRYASFWETFATLARTGHRDPKLLWQLDPTSAQAVWATLAPWVRRMRAELGQPGYVEQLEWLAGMMAEMDRRGGRPAFTSDSIPIQMKCAIAQCQDQIRLAQELRTVTVAQPVAVTVTRPRPASKRPVSRPAIG